MRNNTMPDFPEEAASNLPEVTTSFEGALGVATLEVIEPPQHFLTLPIRRVLYILSLAGFVAAPVLAVTMPEYAAAIVTGAGVLGTAALGTALANPSRGF